MTNLKQQSFGTWPGAVDATPLFDRPGPYSHPEIAGGQLYWLESQPQDGGRLALMSAAPDGNSRCVTPAPFNIRSRVHEYGGRAHGFTKDGVIFSNFADQRLWYQSLVDGNGDVLVDAEPVALTAAPLADGTTAMYADIKLHPNGRWLFCVLEIFDPVSADQSQNLNAIACIDWQAALDGQPVEPCIIAQGADFYASPALSPDGKKLAYFRWSHPAMPWDASEVIEHTLEVDGGMPRAMGERHMAGGGHSSCCQVSYHLDGALWWAMDEDSSPGLASDYWNWYRNNSDTPIRVTRDQAEYGAAHWVFGWQRIAHIDANCHAAIRTKANGDELVRVSDSGEPVVVETSYNDFYHITRVPPEYRDLWQCDAVLIAGSDVCDPVIVGLDAGRRQLVTLQERHSTLNEESISRPRAICVDTRDGEKTHAYFYAPTAPGLCGVDDERPPLVVMVHGGPTSRTSPGFDLAKQYWTSRGFAVLDVNHRGSTGYGRAFRQRLCGNWGVIDATDVVDCIQSLIDSGKVDPARVCVRGGSAGGYLVLNVLTRFPDTFAVGACYYGIGNLITLCQTTHKFEKYYVDVLVGQTFDDATAHQPDSVFVQRSPQHHADRIRSAMILFQGGADKVVPPEVSREMVAELAKLGITHDYIEYPDEGHGFRNPATRVDALERELAFFQKALGMVTDNPAKKSG